MVLQPLCDCPLKPVDKLEMYQKGRQKICGKGKGAQGWSQRGLSLQAANEALGKWLPTEAGPAVLCRKPVKLVTAGMVGIKCARERKGAALLNRITLCGERVR